MNRSLIPYLRCTSGCESELSIPADSGDPVIDEGVLTCGSCGREYIISDGIVRMLPENLDNCSCAPDEGTIRKQSEIQARDAQVEDYDRMWYLNLFGRIEIPFTLRRLRLRLHHTLLEAGCGTGRMTREFASRCSRLISVDYSFESLKVCASKLKESGVSNVDLIQADICRLPLKSEQFNRVVSCQVLEHIPTPDCRGSAVRDLSRVMISDGRLVISAYRHSLLTRLFGEKEGEHDGGIYFFRFSRDELRDLLSGYLEVEAVNGAMVYHFTASCRKKAVN